MNIWISLIAALIGYFLGAISFARLLGRKFAPDENLEKTTFAIPGSDQHFELKSVSATSIAMRKGPKEGCLTSILDMLKVTLPTLAFRLIFPHTYYYLIAAAAGVAGHNYPIYYGFKGGRGMSPLFGGLLIIDWLAIPITTAASMIIGLLLLKDVFFSYFGTILLLIPWILYRFTAWPYWLYAVAINVLCWSATLPELTSYIKLKQSGIIQASNPLDSLGEGHTGVLIEFARKRGWIKNKEENIP